MRDTLRFRAFRALNNEDAPSFFNLMTTLTLSAEPASRKRSRNVGDDTSATSESKKTRAQPTQQENNSTDEHMDVDSLSDRMNNLTADDYMGNSISQFFSTAKNRLLPVANFRTREDLTHILQQQTQALNKILDEFVHAWGTLVLLKDGTPYFPKLSQNLLDEYDEAYRTKKNLTFTTVLDFDITLRAAAIDKTLQTLFALCALVHVGIDPQHFMKQPFGIKFPTTQNELMINLDVSKLLLLHILITYLLTQTTHKIYVLYPENLPLSGSNNSHFMHRYIALLLTTFEKDPIFHSFTPAPHT